MFARPWRFWKNSFNARLVRSWRRERLWASAAALSMAAFPPAPRLGVIYTSSAHSRDLSVESMCLVY